MDCTRFDALTRALAHQRSRRAVLGGLAAVALGAARPANAATPAPPTKFTISATKTSSAFTGASANAINASGQVAGFVIAPDAASGKATIHPMLFSKGKVQLLGKKGTSGSALDINDDGQTVGLLVISGDQPTSRPAMFTASGSTDLGSLGGAGIAAAINNAGQIVGNSALSNEQGALSHAFLWAKGKMTDLGALADGAGSAASDINEQGMIVGSSATQSGAAASGPGTHAVLWRKGKAVDLGVLPGGDVSFAIAVNASGQIIGGSTTGPGQTLGLAGTQAFLWSKGKLTMLPAPDGSSACEAVAINMHGWAVGGCATPGTDPSAGDSIAVLWAGGRAIDLNAAADTGGKWTIIRGHGINDAGHIACTALDSAKAAHALILTPVVG